MATVAPYGTWTSPDLRTDRRRAGAPARLRRASTATTSTGSKDGRTKADATRSSSAAPTARSPTSTPRDHNVRTRVHEYGGGAYVVSNGVVYYSNFADQRIYRIASRVPGRDPTPITPEGQVVLRRRERSTNGGSGSSAFARITRSDGHEPVTTLVSIRLDRRSPERRRRDRVRLRLLLDAAPQSRRLAARVAVVAASADAVGRHRAVGCRRHATQARSMSPELVAGGPHESIYQPGWSPDGTLYFASDRTGWWSLYKCDVRSAKCEVHSRCVLASRWTRRSSDARSGCSAGRPGRSPTSGAWSRPTRSRGRWTLATIDTRSGNARPTCRPDLEPLEWLDRDADARGLRRRVARHAAGRRAHEPRRPASTEMLRSSSTLTLDRRHISMPEAIEFPTEGGVTAHAFYYPPRNAEFTALAVRPSAADRHQPRRPDDADQGGARSAGAVLDEPRLRGGRRELRRQLRLRPRVPRSASTGTGASSTSTTASTRRSISSSRGRRIPIG